MDSLSQIALGSAVAIGVMGRRTAVWKAATWGAIAGTLPDLDVVIDHGDALLNMVLHRAESHALFWLTLFAPLMAWVVSRIHREAHLFRRWWLSLWLVLVTHPLLDAMTVYGTQLLLPFTNHPYGVGSVFIIDPAYTLPLVVGVVAALRMKDAARGLRWNAVGLVLSTAYLAWSNRRGLRCANRASRSGRCWSRRRPSRPCSGASWHCPTTRPIRISTRPMCRCSMDRRRCVLPPTTAAPS